jgi:hypothetical protein
MYKIIGIMDLDIAPDRQLKFDIKGELSTGFESTIAIGIDIYGAITIMSHNKNIDTIFLSGIQYKKGLT